jgi:hypothetical protein
MSLVFPEVQSMDKVGIKEDEDGYQSRSRL